ncbi:MAG: 50S ribosomal protein L30 [Candidatus Diapherotrites archaeon]|nr:50S ribosomal protein L30 [Candidatus Diapherotrites archaeon]
MAWAVVRVRGSVGVKGDIEETMRRLKLTRVNHAVVIPETPVYEGMVKKAKDYITWGEIDKETLAELILRRGEFIGGGRVSKEELEKRTGMKFDELLDRVLSNQFHLHKILKPFRLHPPRKGYRSIKQPFKVGGALGYRGAKINELLRRMI